MATTSLPVRKALIKAKLTPASLTKEINSGLKEPSGEIYKGIRDRYLKVLNEIPAEELTKGRDLVFRNEFERNLHKYNLNTQTGRTLFCKYLYDIDLAGSGLRV